MIDPSCDHWSQNTNIFKLNKNTIFPYSFSFDPVSSPSNHLLKNSFFTSFFILDSTVLRKMDHFDISFVIWKLCRSRELTKPTWIRTTSQVADTSYWSSALLPIFLYGIAWLSWKNSWSESGLQLEHQPEASTSNELAYFGTSFWSLGFFDVG